VIQAQALTLHVPENGVRRDACPAPGRVTDRGHLLVLATLSLRATGAGAGEEEGDDVLVVLTMSVVGLVDDIPWFNEEYYVSTI